MKTDVKASEETPTRIIADRYRLVERLAGGGMGSVWMAHDNRLGRQIAVKVMSPEFGRQESFRERFRFEARAAAGLAHPNIATVYDYGEEKASPQSPPLPYIVMELVEGESLESVLGRRGKLPMSTTMDIVGQAARGLQAAHDRGIVHRDVKPGNLLVRPDGLVKVTDFGIAKAVTGSALTQTNNLLGTPQFMSPEQLTGDPATASSDVYALGVVAYLCLSGRPPFEGGEPMAVAMAHVHRDVPPLPAEVDRDVSALVYAMLAKEPAERPPSAFAVASTALRLRSRSTRPVSMAHVVVTDSPRASEQVAQAGGITVVTEPHEQQEPSADDSTTVFQRTRTVVFPVAGLRDPRTSRPRTSWRKLALLLGVRRVRYGLLLGFVAVALLWWAITPDPVVAAVPALTGNQFVADSAALQQFGFKVTEHMVDGPSAPGTVLSQSPLPGSRLSSGSTVTLNVASGYVDVNSQTLLGATAAQAVSTLTSEGLVPILSSSGGTSTSSDTSNSSDTGASSGTAGNGTAGTVVGVSPSGRVAVGSEVNITVALPAPAKPTPAMPAKSSPPAHGGHH